MLCGSLENPERNLAAQHNPATRQGRHNSHLLFTAAQEILEYEHLITHHTSNITKIMTRNAPKYFRKIVKLHNEGNNQIGENSKKKVPETTDVDTEKH